ncbi:unnamed protein product [Clonostachys byssicola]|uniref:Short-chain dehydrogenase/reductase 3 n=1 Tax=Clonostachys byssicola TaxID=160290 RepID=A0A9N9U7Z7_9HYPO|nr:unnamed protein product [Clonostachys byssicola]
MNSPGWDALHSLHRAITSPLLNGPILATLNFAPDSVRQLLQTLAERFPWLHVSPSFVNTPQLVWILKALFLFGVIDRLNKLANSIAANNFRLTAATGWDWPNEVAVVTGGSGGIGRHICEQLAAAGVRVAVLDVQELPKALESNPRIRHYSCDITSEDSIAAAATGVRMDFGHPSILVNNAGYTRPAPILQTPPSVVRTVFGVNSISMWLTTQEFLTHMIMQNKGHVVTVASIVSFVTLPSSADYCATKAAALSFHEALKVELRNIYKAPNILTSIVHPYFAQTALVEDIKGVLDSTGVRMLPAEKVAEQIVGQVLSKKGGQVMVPRNIGVISRFRGLPLWLQEVVRNGIGILAARHILKDKSS